MSLGDVTPERERQLIWLVIIHVVFVVSSVLLALSDRIVGHAEHAEESTAAAGVTKPSGH